MQNLFIAVQIYGAYPCFSSAVLLWYYRPYVGGLLFFLLHELGICVEFTVEHLSML